MDCIFCRIAAGEIPADKVYEDDRVVAFRDINPQAPTHVLLIPKKHVESVARLEDPELAGYLMEKAAAVARSLGLEDKGYRLVINHGPLAGQSVFHLHIHILGGRPLSWPPG
ncbi:MAG: histidine triad nucleotide-binding protein [Candidatus Hydrothermae bacterium]|nr:histidine triad nucleotide-binding protein [Candidatus Hydrothermae bacterium]